MTRSSSGTVLPVWQDGRLREAHDPGPAIQTGTSCYSTARVVKGRTTRVERHARRLRRDAARIGLPVPPTDAIERGLVELGRAAFPGCDGIVRISLYAKAGEPGHHLLAEARELGPEPPTWKAVIAPVRHPGPEWRRGAKVHGVDCIEAARAFSAEKGADEAILLDADGMLVEGARASLLLIDPDGRWLVPELGAGGVEGLAQEVLREARPEIRPAKIPETALRAARELFAVNAVRGAVPITSIDGAPVGSGEPGPNADLLRAVFALV